MSYSRYISEMGDRAAVEPAPACISAISGNRRVPVGLRPGFLGQDVFIHQNYLEFRPLYPDMDLSREKIKGLKPEHEKTFKDQMKKRRLHYSYKKNQYDNNPLVRFETNPDNFRIVDGEALPVTPPPELTTLKKAQYDAYHMIQFESNSDNFKVVGDEILPLSTPPELTPLGRAQYEAHHNSASILYTKPKHKFTSPREKRGIITKVSKKSSNRLKKFLASIPDLGLWVDFTFPDDVMFGKTLEERKDFANECLKKLKRFIHKIGLKEVWKKEFTDRKSGKLKGLSIPHYHIALAGLSRQQAKDWQMTCIKILVKWIQIIGTNDDNALKVACHRKSFRKIHHSRQAISYIGKYFSKTDEVQDENGDTISIGRAWGYAQVLKDEIPDPKHLFLNYGQSIQFGRFMKRYKRLKPNKKFIGAYEHITNGYSTFLFADKGTLLQFLESIGVDVMQDSGVPF